ncbi:MAG: tetratricopeptide repeat protein [Candidatus Delongbacteria bacterium]|nr:tetratricopeptide repeat protein [Candidatus Delongbacteria bacterium]MBN2834640.1 tetratricopeptide repeat protein [Candidatus Delongbacteria bacterium]
MFEELEDLFKDDLFDQPFDTEVEKIFLKDGERRKVSILFADIKGFTSLSEKLDHEHVKFIIDKLLKAFTLCIGKYGGYIDKYEGDLVMALFGAKKASENDTERALRSALDMLEALKMFNRYMNSNTGMKDINTEIAVRIGVNTGYVTTGKVGQEREGDFTVYGDAVNTASRLESSAPVNSILITDESLKPVEHIFDFYNFGELTVKGKSEKLITSVVTGLKKIVYPRWVLKKSRFVGREDIFPIFNKVYEKNDNIIELVEITGSPGIGKSRCVYEFFRACFSDTSVIHLQVKGFSDCINEQPYGLFSTIFKHLTGIYPGDDQNAINMKIETFLNVLKEEISESSIRELLYNITGLEFLCGKAIEKSKYTPDTLSDYILLTVRSVILSLAERSIKYNRPFLVVLDNLQWIDSLSLQILSKLLVSLNNSNLSENQKIIFFMISRENLPLSTEIIKNFNFTKINLEPLNKNEIKILTESILGTQAPEDFLDKVADSSGGNPYFVEEWLSYITDKGNIHDDKGKLIIDIENIEVPDSINSLILSRIDIFESNLKLLLQKASVIGREFTEKLLTELENRIDSSLKDVTQFIKESLTTLKKINFIDQETDSDARYSFRNPMSWQVAYNTLLLQNRKIIHKLIAEIIEKSYSNESMNIEEVVYHLANHYDKAEVVDKAKEYLLKAGELAKSTFDNKNALYFYDRYISLFSEPKTDLCPVLLEKGEVLYTIGEWDTAATIYEKILENKALQENLKAKTWRQFGTIMMRRGFYDKAEEYFTSAIVISEKIKDLKELANSTANIGIVYKIIGKIKLALDCYKTSLDIFNKIDDEAGYARVVGNLGIIYKDTGDYEKAIECYNKKIQISLKYNNVKELAFAYGNLGIVHEELSEFDKAKYYYLKKKELATKLGDLRSMAMVLGNLCSLNTKIENSDAAMDLAKNQLEILESLGDKRGQAMALTNIGNLLLNYSSPDKALELFKQALKINEQINDKSSLAITLFNIGTCYYYLDQDLEAISYFKESASIAELIKSVYIKMHILNFLIELLLSKNNQEEALPLLDFYTKNAEKFPSDHFIPTSKLFREFANVLSSGNFNWTNFESLIPDKEETRNIFIISLIRLIKVLSRYLPEIDYIVYKNKFSTNLKEDNSVLLRKYFEKI